jgi:hypothetical protein
VNYGGVALWQDRANSMIKFAPDSNNPGNLTGNLDLSCSFGADGKTAPTINNPCTNSGPVSPELDLQSTPNTTWTGVVYQPRGDWTNMLAAGTYQGPLQIITGSMDVHGSGTLTLQSPSRPIQTLKPVLVE